MQLICPIAFQSSYQVVTIVIGGAVAATFGLAVLGGGTSNRYRIISKKSGKKRAFLASFVEYWAIFKKLFATQSKLFGLTLSFTKLKVLDVSAKSLTGIQTPEISLSASALTRSTLFLCPHFSYGGAVSATFGLAALSGGSLNRYRVITRRFRLSVDDLNLSSTLRA